MRTVTKCFAFILIMLASGGCSSNPTGTHRANLLDEKVAEQRVKAELGRAGPNFNSVQVQATNGAVVLSGTVRSSQIRSRAEQIARSVDGVTRLQNDLEVGK